MKLFRTKDIPLHVKDMDMKSGKIQMYVSSFGFKDSDGDIMQRGAFAKTIRENFKRIKHLWQHDTRTPIGRPEEIKEDDFGLLVTGFVSEVRNGDYRKLYEDGIITEHSIGFIPMVEDQDRENEVNIIKEVKLFEYSSVTWGANEHTPVVKSMTKEDADDLFDRMDKLTKAIRKGTYTDDTFYLLEMELERIKSIIKKAIEPPAGTQEPDESTQKAFDSLLEKLKQWN